jgi:hypothetical protein
MAVRARSRRTMLKAEQAAEYDLLNKCWRLEIGLRDTATLQEYEALVSYEQAEQFAAELLRLVDEGREAVRRTEGKRPEKIG